MLLKTIMPILFLYLLYFKNNNNQETLNDNNKKYYHTKIKKNNNYKFRAKEQINKKEYINSFPLQTSSKYMSSKKSNPIKRKNIIKINSLQNNIYIGNNSKNKRNKIINNVQKKSLGSKHILIKEKGIKIKLSKEQLYKMFLLIIKYTDLELNTLSFKKARHIAKRNYCIYYFSLIRSKHLLFFSFFPKFDYNSSTLKKFLFFLNFIVNFVINALFFNDNTMHKIYTDGGSFNFIYNIPQILYSSIISGFILSIITTLALSDSYFIKLKQCLNKKDVKIKKSKGILRVLKIKFVLFFTVNIILLILFWFYLACFCAVYKNTQLHLIKDTLISFGTSMIYPFGIYLIPGIFRIIALKRTNKECIYNFSKILEML